MNDGTAGEQDNRDDAAEILKEDMNTPDKRIPANVTTDGSDSHVINDKPDEPKLLSADDILAVKDFPRKYVDVPEWGGTVLIEALSEQVCTSIVSRFANNPDKLDFRTSLVAASLITAAGARMFTKRDVEKLSNKSFAAMGLVVKAVLVLNNLSERMGDKEANLSETRDDDFASF